MSTVWVGAIERTVADFIFSCVFGVYSSHKIVTGKSLGKCAPVLLR